jgi:hypothetical protein
MNMPQNIVKPKPYDAVLKIGRFKFFGGAFAIALLLFIAVQWPQRTSDAARVIEPSIGSVSESLSPPSEYFPAQYRNSAQNASPEEHIQAF